jgi:hypothetical protein
MLSAEEAFRRLAIGDHDPLAEVADPPALSTRTQPE